MCFDIETISKLENLFEYLIKNNSKFYFKKASRPISTYKLNVLLHVHFMPINLVVSEESLGGRSPREI